MMSAEDLRQLLGRPLSDFSELRELRLAQGPDSDGDSELRVDLVMTTRDGRARVELRAFGVQAFQVEFAGTPAQISGLDVQDLRPRQLEGLSWRVFDYEERDIEFLCRDLEVELVPEA